MRRELDWRSSSSGGAGGVGPGEAVVAGPAQPVAVAALDQGGEHFGEPEDPEGDVQIQEEEEEEKHDNGPRRSGRQRFAPELQFDSNAYEQQLRFDRAQVNSATWWEEQAEAQEEEMPKDVREAKKHKDWRYLRAALKEELRNHEEAKTMRPVRVQDTSPQQKERWHRNRVRRRLVGEARLRKVIDARIVFEKKMMDPSKALPAGPTYREDEHGKKWRYKARLVAKGFQQGEEDYGETYLPTPKWKSVLVMLALAVEMGWVVHALDVKTAFLIPVLPEEERLLVRLPAGTTDDDREELRELLKCIYGLKQSGHRWHLEVDKTMAKAGFVPTAADPCVYVREESEGRVACCICVHVDDILLGAKQEVMAHYKHAFKSDYTVTDDGEATWYLKTRVRWSDKGRSVSLTQAEYTEETLRTAGLWACHVRDVPAAPHAVMRYGEQLVDAEQTEEEKTARRADAKASVLEWERRRGPYRTVVGKLGYLSDRTRPDITYAVRCVQKAAADVWPEHCTAVDQILRYLKGTINYGLCFQKGNVAGANEVERGFGLVGYSDSDHAGQRDRKSMLGYVFKLSGAAVSWGCGAAKHVTRSASESEISALDEAAREALWLRRLCMQLRVPGAGCVPVLVDNAHAEGFANGAKVGERLKHLDILDLAVRGNVTEGKMTVSRVPTTDNTSDIFTKALGKVLFRKHRTGLGVCRVCE